MEPIRPFVVNLFWDGNVTCVNGNLSYDDETKRSSIVVRHRLSFEDFLELCYGYVGVSKDTCKLSLHLFYQYQGADFTSEILGDDSLETLYFFASLHEQYWGNILIKKDDIEQVQSLPIMHQLYNFSVATDAGPSTYAQIDYYTENRIDVPSGPLSLDFVATDAGPSTYAQIDYSTVNRVEVPSVPLTHEGGTAIVGGFEELCEDVSSEHSEQHDDSSPNVSDDDDESDEVPYEYVPETQPRTQDAALSTLHQQTGYQDLPEWAEEEELDMWSASSGVIRCGMYFKGKKELDHAVRLWNVQRGREINIVDSNTSVYKARCYSRHKAHATVSEQPECQWLVRASKRKNTHLWMIYKWVEEHNCYGTVVRNNNRSLRSKVIATHITHFIKQDVAYPVKHVQAHIKDVLHVDVSYQKAWHGRRKAIERIYGSWESNFKELPRYISALVHSNPNTVIQWKHHDSSSSHGAMFKYVFWAFGPAIEAFNLCHPVVCIDGTHLKGSYKGKLLTAVTKDANNHVLPVAYAIVDGETNESWAWFLEQFRLFVAKNSTRSLCVISDRHAGIINAMQTSEYWKEPLAYHRFCLRHVRSNLMSHFKMFPMKRLCWALGSTTQRRKYAESVREMKRIKPEAWNYLKEIRTSKWTLLHDTHHRRWGNLTTNIAESMNNSLKVARLLPIQACIDHTFNKTVEHFRKNSETAMNCTTPLPPRMWRLYVIRERHAQEHTITEFDYIDQIYRVVSRLTTNETGGNDYTVQYKDSTCSCGKWQMTRFPCSHAIAVCRHRGDNIHAIVNRVYRTRTYQQQYRCDFSPLPHKAYWQDPGWTIRADSSRITTARGRRRARRMRNEMDSHYPEETRVRRCTICKQPGHTRTICPNTQPSYD